jgi:hypothetical protein
MARERPDRLVTIGRFWSVGDADLARALLETESIPAALADVNSRILAPHAVQYVRLQVRAADAPRAVEVLRRRADENGPLQGDIAELPKCPKCASHDLTYGRPSRALAILSWLLLGVPFLLMRRRWRCTACGHAWKA